MKKRILAMLLCFTLVFTTAGYAGWGVSANVHAETGVNVNEFNVKSVYQQLICQQSVEDMYAVILELMGNDPDGLKALTAEEIEMLRAHIDVIDPEKDDADTEDLLDTLAVLPNGGKTLDGDPVVLPEGTVFSSTGGVVNSGTYYLGNNLDINSSLQINKGAKVVLDLNGYVLRNKKGGIVIEINGGDLTINDSRPTLGHQGNVGDDGLWKWVEGNHPMPGGIIYNGGTGQGITVTGGGLLTMNGGTIAGCQATTGPAITLTSSGNLVMNGGKILYNVNNHTSKTASGGAIHGEPSNSKSGAVGSSMILENVTIANNKSNGAGGGIYGFDITLKKCTIENNTANFGAGIYVNKGARADKPEGSLTVENCTISNNISADHGGGIYGASSTIVEVSNGTIISNNKSTGGNGGGIYAVNVILSGTSSNRVMIADNRSDRYGGGIFADGGSCQIAYSTIDDNHTGISGGGVYACCNSTVSNTDITNNRAMTAEGYDGTADSVRTDRGRGGGFFLVGSSTLAPEGTFTNVNVCNNAAMYYGGGIQVGTNAKLTFVSGAISYNEVILHGAGGVHVTSNATFTLSGGEISYNKAHSVGGGIHSSYSCVLNLTGGEIKHNTVYGRGGGVHVNVGGNLKLEGTKITDNKAYDGTVRLGADIDEENGTWSNITDDGSVVNGYGGGVVIDAGTCTMTDGELSNNWAETGGGGIAFVMINTAASQTDRFYENKVVSFDLQNGEIKNNRTDGNGAGIYLMRNRLSQAALEEEGRGTYDDEGNLYHIEGSPYIYASGGTVSNNIAKGNGGAAYQEEGTKFTISDDAAVEYNEAILNGGGVYIASGEAEIQGGSISNNKAGSAGGGMYIAGNVTMTDGVVNENTAVTAGGAAYISGGDLVMTSGRMQSNKATGAGSNGGAVLLNDGSAVIGIENCTGEGTNHTEEPKDKIHPVIQNNEAKDSGGGIALLGDGNITMYCGVITENTATNRGRGLNVYMEVGTFKLYNGNIGALENPELVIVGGKLEKIDSNGNQIPFVNLYYYHCNDNEDAGNHIGELVDKEAYASLGSNFNLPDGEKYWDAPDGYRFFGWTFFGPNTEDAKKTVRSKDDYQEIGTSIVSSGRVDNGKDDNELHMYALWAPDKSDITYKGIVVGDEYEEEVLENNTNPTKYNFAVESNVVTLKAPTKAGYKFLGWYLYQEEGQNANWGDDYEPVYKKGTTEKVPSNLDYSQMSDNFLSADEESGIYNLEMGTTFFGDITLIAKFEPIYADLTISKEVTDGGGIDDDQTFVFHISGTPDAEGVAPIDMDVIISNFDKTNVDDGILAVGTKEIIHLPAGNYTVTEVSSWSWRYNLDSINGNSNISQIVVDINKSTEDYSVTFTNTRNKPYWLGGLDYAWNLYKS